MKDRDKLLLDNAFRDVNRYEPPRVTVTRRRHGEKAAKAMKAGIAFDTARRQGAKLPKKGHR